MREEVVSTAVVSIAGHHQVLDDVVQFSQGPAGRGDIRKSQPQRFRCCCCHTTPHNHRRGVYEEQQKQEEMSGKVYKPYC